MASHQSSLSRINSRISRPILDRAELGRQEWAWIGQTASWRLWDWDSQADDWVPSGPPPAEARFWQSPASLRTHGDAAP